MSKSFRLKSGSRAVRELKALASQTRIFGVSESERARNLCSLCMGHRRLCGKGVCPILVKAESLMKLERRLSAQNIFGSSPPAVFIGSWNYPKVLAGPLVPPILEEDTSVMDQPERWLNRSFEEILSYRMQLVRGELFANVRSAANPDRVTSTFQEHAPGSRLQALTIDRKRFALTSRSCHSLTYL